MKEITAFASGVNEAREIAGFALASVPIGASASDLREDAIQAILRAAGPVFLVDCRRVNFTISLYV